MSHKNKKMLFEQSHERFMQMRALGRSKAADKKRAAKEWEQLPKPKPISKIRYINREIQKYIYSGKTWETCEEQVNLFIRWVRANPAIASRDRRSLDQIKQYFPAYYNEYSKTHSAYSIYTMTCAIAKLYQVPTYILAPEISKIKRERASIKNNRGENIRDDDADPWLDKVGRSTGLRREGLEKLTPSMLCRHSDIPHHELWHVAPGFEYYIHIREKGGRWRYAPVIGTDANDVVTFIMSCPPNDPVFVDIPEHYREHRRRAIYAQTLYRHYERDADCVPPSDRYYCRKDLVGTIYDSVAMRYTSYALGHGRISIIASHYLY